MMNSLALFVLLFSFCQALAQDMQLPETPLAGHKLFTARGCINCHSIMGQGGTLGSDLGKTQAGKSPAGIVSLMWNHVSDMMRVMERSFEMPKFTSEEMGSIIAFLYFLNYFDEPGDAGRGAAVISEKQCIRCHSVRGNGGTVGPTFDSLNIYASPILLAQSMWNHSGMMSGAMEFLSVERPTLQGSDIADVLAFIRSTSRGNIRKEIYMVPGDPKTGARLFESKNCIQCHKVGKRGRSIGPDLAKKTFNVGATDIAATMWNHGSKMTAKMKELHIEQPTFQGSEMADVVAYLYFLGFVSQSGNVEHGKRMFSDKKCAECHAIRGLGGNVGPDLSTSKNVSNLMDAAAAMWNHGFHMQLLMEKVKIPVPRFTAEEMNDLLTYIRSSRLEK